MEGDKLEIFDIFNLFNVKLNKRYILKYKVKVVCLELGLWSYNL